MSRKKFFLDRGRGFVSRDPAHFPSASASLQRFCLLILISFSAYWWHCHRVERATSQWWLSVSTMVLSEARGLWLFLGIRGGIKCNGVLGAYAHRARSHLLILPSNRASPELDQSSPTRNS